MSDIYYDRTVSSEFLDLFVPGGSLSGLVEIARSGHVADLELRSYPHSSLNRATLYAGTTKFLDIDNRGDQYKLSAHPTHMAKGPLIRWKQRLTLAEVNEQWDALSRYVAEQIRQISDRFTLEGAIQAMLCVHAGTLFSAVDREAVIGFRDTALRTTCYSTVRDEIQDGLPEALSGNEWARSIPQFGGELDLLAVGHDGSLLVIEIKPGSARKGISWAPVQATFYAGLFRSWIAEVGDVAAKEVVDSMLRQRIKIGLSYEPRRALSLPIEIQPIVAIGGEVDQIGLERLRTVQEALVSAGGGYENLEVWHVVPSVRRQRLL